MFQITKTGVELNKAVKLSKKQLSKLNSLDKEDQLKYVLSILGHRHSLRSVNFAFKVRGVDHLASNNNRVKRAFEQLLNNDDHVNHKPRVKSKDCLWVGVEIECYISELGWDDCDYCDGTGNESCYNCEGHGEITLGDGNGNSYDVSCAECGGDGYRDCHECDGGGRPDYYRLRNALKQAGVTRCSVREDGSLDQSKGGVEICHLFDASKGFKSLEKLCKVLNDFDAQVDSTCGLHVHIDFSQDIKDSELNRLGNRLKKFLPALCSFVPDSRLEGTYCKPQVSNRDRYSAINLTSFKKHGTVEFRLHTATVNFEKIKNWVDLLNTLKKFVLKRPVSKQPSKPVSNFQDFIDFLSLPEYLVEHFDKRQTKFASESRKYGLAA